MKGERERGKVGEGATVVDDERKGLFGRESGKEREGTARVNVARIGDGKLGKIRKK